MTPTVNKPRLSNIELLRIVAMLLIVMTHTNIFSLGRPKVAAFEAEPMWVGARFAAQSFTYIGVNLFILISGWFAIRPKFRGVAAFLFQILFFSLFCLGGLEIVGLCIGRQLVTMEMLGNSFMILTRFNWFIPAYLVLMTLAPAINAYCDKATRGELATTIVCLLAASTYLGWATHYSKEWNDGYSFASLLLLYMTGRFLRLHTQWLTTRGWRTDAVHFLIYVAVNTAIALWRIRTPYKMSLFALNNPLELYGAVCFFLFFAKIKLQSEWVNRIARGTFGIFLVQMHPQVMPYFRQAVKAAYASCSHTVFSLAALGIVMAFSVAGVLVDIVRQRVWALVDRPLCQAYEHIKQRVCKSGVPENSAAQSDDNSR